MPDLEVTIFNHKIKLSYQENEKARLINAVEILNENWKKVSHLHGKVSDIKIITLISLELQDSLANLNSLKDNLKTKELKIELLQKEIEKKNSEIKKSLKNINKFELELAKQNDELLKIENIVDDFNDDLLDIKNNILNKNHE